MWTTVARRPRQQNHAFTGEGLLADCSYPKGMGKEPKIAKLLEPVRR